MNGLAKASEFGMSGKLALVTGGASGIGRACAQWLADHDSLVVIADRNEAAAREVGKALGGYAYTVDVRDAEGIATVVGRIEEEIGPLDVLVNAAGVLQNPLPPDRLTMKEWDLVTGIDLRGTYAMCAAAGGRMAARGAGSVVNIASVAGLRAGRLHAYGPAKAAVIALTESLASEWGPRGVRVNAVSPGFTRTPAVEKGITIGVLDEDRLAAATALGRLIEPSEIAAAVGFLASPLASAITGVNLTVDAGFLVADPGQAYGEAGA